MEERNLDKKERKVPDKLRLIFTLLFSTRKKISAITVEKICSSLDALSIQSHSLTVSLGSLALPHFLPFFLKKIFFKCTKKSSQVSKCVTAMVEVLMHQEARKMHFTAVNSFLFSALARKKRRRGKGKEKDNCQSVCLTVLSASRRRQNRTGHCGYEK